MSEVDKTPAEHPVELESVESFLNEIKQVLEENLDEREKLYNEYEKRMRQCTDWEQEEKLAEERDEEEIDLDVELYQKLDEVFSRHFEKYNAEMELVDSWIPSSAINFKHTKLEYHIGAAVLSANTVISITAVITKAFVYGEWQFWLDELSYEILPLISEGTTPFTYKLINNIPWELVREEWTPQINYLIYQLAEKELEGELEQGIKDLRQVCENNSWIYEYQHVLRALLQLLS